MLALAGKEEEFLADEQEEEYDRGNDDFLSNHVSDGETQPKSSRTSAPILNIKLILTSQQFVRI
jgi:hypothetical protein